MYHLKSIGKPLDEYIWKKAKMLEFFNINVKAVENIQGAVLEFRFEHKETDSKLVSALSYHQILGMNPNDVADWIDYTFQDALVKMYKHIGVKIDKGQLLLVNPVTPAYGTDEPYEYTNPAWNPKTITKEELEKSIADLKAQSKYKDDYMQYYYNTPSSSHKIPVGHDGSGTTGGGETIGLLSKHFDMTQKVRCRDCDQRATLKTTVIHMNDDHGVPRTEIADYLESQDLNLEMKIAAE